MIESFERLVRAAGGDGASAAVDALPVPDQAEVDLLMEAWSRERGRSIECTLLLGLVGRLLSRALAQGRSTDRDAREVRRIIRSIAMIREGDPEADP